MVAVWGRIIHDLTWRPERELQGIQNVAPGGRPYRAPNMRRNRGYPGPRWRSFPGLPQQVALTGLQRPSSANPNSSFKPGFYYNRKDFPTACNPCRPIEVSNRIVAFLTMGRSTLRGLPGMRVAFHGTPPVKLHPWGGVLSESQFYSLPTCRTLRKASWGISMRPTDFIRRLPFFCFSSSLRLRVTSPP